MNREQKLARIARAEKHARLDLLVAGSYIDNRSSSQLKGCSVGCDAIDIQIRNDVEIWELVDENCHKIVAEHDGTPEWLEHLRDAVFENCLQMTGTGGMWSSRSACLRRMIGYLTTTAAALCA